MANRAFRWSGFPTNSFEEFQSFLSAIFPQVSRVDLRGGARRYEWLERNHLGLAMFVEGGDFRCVIPFFEGKTFIRPACIEFEANGDCRWCELVVADVVSDSGDVLYPLRLHNAEGPRLKSLVKD